MIKFNKSDLRDRIYACWLGKSIGGTMGAPYEGGRDILDIQGFSTPSGKPLPNDDLDLQLVWLKAMDELGPDGINANVLAEYWLSYITPNWNEYGVGKSNLREGLLPPLSGEVNNDEWRHSNGAWIRTEIWACLYPGLPDKAISFAFEDASVDHGYSEGSLAAVFVASLQSAAFVVNDINTLLDIGLTKIPHDCRVSKSVRLVREAYARGDDWKTVRNALVEESSDIGWFQAPANIGFVVLGLLYGEGDFKKSMILAINCGDDSDCTGATIGSLMGIMKGTKGIPEDWRQYIGDEIITICLLNGHGAWPKSCRMLTDCVMNLLPVTLRKPHQKIINGMKSPVVLTDEASDFSEFSPDEFMGDEFIKNTLHHKRHSYRMRSPYSEIWVEFDNAPRIRPGESLTGQITAVLINMPEQKHFHLRWILPEGWHANGRLNLHANFLGSNYRDWATAPFTLTVSEGAEVKAVNRIILEAYSPGRAQPLLIPVVVLG